MTKKDGLPDYAALMVVGVDAYQLGVPEGRLFNCYLESYIPFYGIMDLFLRIDQILDALDRPQATFERRWLSGRDLDNLAAKPPVFLPKSSLVRYWEPGEIKKILTSKTRFYIRVLFRQNATWQGSVEWPEGRRRMNFRSALEVGEMILEALERMDIRGRWIARPAAEVEKLLRDSRQAGE